MSDKTRIVKIVAYVVDIDDWGEKNIRQELEGFQDGLVTVTEMESKFVDWSDDHPLNKIGKNVKALAELFPD